MEDLSKNETRGFDKSTSFFFLSLSPLSLLPRWSGLRIPINVLKLKGIERGEGKKIIEPLSRKLKVNYTLYTGGGSQPYLTGGTHGIQRLLRLIKTEKKILLHPRTPVLHKMSYCKACNVYRWHT